MATENTQQTSEALDQALGDVHAVAKIYSCSDRHVFRMANEGKMPQPIKVGRLVRWRLRTGDPRTGVYDHIAAGCPSVAPANPSDRESK